MSADKKVPDIRFKGFSGEWLEATLSNIIDVRSGKDYKHLGKGNIPVYGTGGYMLSVDSALSNNEDAIGIGRKGTIDKPYILHAPFWTVDTLFYAVPFSDFNLDFLFCLFQKINWKKHDESTGVPSLSKIAINNVPVYATNEPEQTTIGNYFQKLDNLINQHQQKHDKLSNIKKAMLEKMFPKPGETVPEIRLKGFSGSWLNNPIGQICGSTFGGGTPSTSEKSFWQGNIPWIQSSDIADGDVSSVNAKKYITKVAVNKSTTKLISGNSIAIVTRVGVGKLSLMKDRFTTSQDFLSLSDLKVDAQFSAYAIWKQLQIEKEQVQGTSIKGITKEELLSKIITFPKSKLEQTAIGNYFQKLDTLIEQHQQQITKLNNIKQACLSKMFI
ncbi:restriction endonuclease subunit S [Proteus faecis]|uniref:restriction endonuclease subunit S n=1 Tax=Proteus faecis TaxID=2050967 RepID=UPI003075B567